MNELQPGDNSSSEKINFEGIKAVPNSEDGSAVYVEDDDEDDETTAGALDIQLGFVEQSKMNNLFTDSDWRNWDGGKVGGHPIWLNPSHPPDPKSLLCRACGEPLAFLLQIYCPSDDVEGAFHRVLYIFCCKKSDCVELSDTGGGVSRGLLCLRSQLPRINEYYCYDPAVPDSDRKSASINIRPNLCALCGCLGHNVCSKCKSTYYCSRTHQKEHWKAHKILCGINSAVRVSHDDAVYTTALNQVRHKHLFPEYSIEVEAEELDQAEDFEHIMQNANIWDDAVTEGGPEEEADAKLKQSDYQKALGSAQHDPAYIRFLTRIGQAGNSDQILRYCRVPAPTPLLSPPSISMESSTADGKQESNTTERTGSAVINSSSSGAVTAGDSSSLHVAATTGTASPSRQAQQAGALLMLTSNSKALKERDEVLTGSRGSCQRCGAIRTFECQIMPQLLHYLHVDKNTSLAPAAAPVAATTCSTGPTGDTAASTATSTSAPATVGVASQAFTNTSNKDIDWGSLDVFTCSASCCSPQYRYKDGHHPSSAAVATSTKTSTSATSTSRSSTADDDYYCEELILIQPSVYGKSTTTTQVAAAGATAPTPTGTTATCTPAAAGINTSP